MPMHDWTLVDSGLYHDFHQRWTVSLSDGLNSGVLPDEYFALVEQSIKGPIPDVLTLKLSGDNGNFEGTGGLAVATAPPKTRVVQRSSAAAYRNKANRISVRHRHGDVVAVIEIVSPGNKSSLHEFREFVQKAAGLIRSGIHLLVIDPFPSGKRDPRGIHCAIWEELEGGDCLVQSNDRPLTLASYDADLETVAYVERIAVGDCIPSLPLFLRPGFYVPAPLESSYEAAWSRFPKPLKTLLGGNHSVSKNGAVADA